MIVTAYAPTAAADLAADTSPVHLDDHDFWTDEMVAAAGIPTLDVPFVSVGGGIGSFVTVDYLRVAGGVPTSDIHVVSNLTHPWQTYEHLARVSQIPRHERIRSDAASRPDNLWGFPSYALSEAARRRTLRPLLQVLVEPVLDDFYTPPLGMVLDGICREAHRIGYWDMLFPGTASLVRRRLGGGYFTLLTPRSASAPSPTLADVGDWTGLAAIRSRDVHIAVGYSGLKFLPELTGLRESGSGFHRVVNAYEDHEHVYEALCRRPSTVLVRGGGIVSSRILERLISDRAQYGMQTRIVHLLRTYVSGSHGPHPWARRRGGGGFAYQGFNYPKSAWGGVLKARMRRLEDEERAEAYAVIGGTTTAYRRSWARQQELGRREGWYRTLAGTIETLRVLDDGAVATRVRTTEGLLEVQADYVIDCTGLNADVDEHEVLSDLLAHGGASRNPLGRMDVERSFELRGTASGDGRLYLSGAAALGGYFPGVDTFLGLQISAQEIVDDLARRGYARRSGVLRSTAEWLKWLTGRQV
jgi:hypothetical protein